MINTNVKDNVKDQLVYLQKESIERNLDEE